MTLRSLSHSPHWQRLALLGGASIPLVGAWLFNHNILAYPWDNCLFQQVFGTISPSCGLTRSFQAIARGDLATACSYHLFGPILFIICLYLWGRALTELLCKPASTLLSIAPLNNRYLLVGLGASFIGYYAMRLYSRLDADWLPQGLTENPIWQFLTSAVPVL
ncbi:hypothetical protein XM38_017020 [Halomicronema hongdechloris C2206]|uniref:DUF2752 domain-containing protein n=1 Tax=Halomicronema hongdechloris C2206 TaxID=1641165 RepID=A0A1Z3HKG8_9CYAN|nr:DUF2752 domain-containing protein [Halomicronema hongdechloris]ASC70756.1 hypothetical protein XM38_017020 [Halomicronema hongdechloris C2206]